MTLFGNMRKIVGLIMALAAVLPTAGRAASWEVRDSVLVIAAGTRSIPAYAFADRADFHTVRLPAGATLREIGDYAFLGCASLREIDLGAGVRKLGVGAFRECGGLRSARISGVTKIPKECFSWCGALEEVVLSRSLADIGSHAFAYCGALRAVAFPSGLAHIGSNAFSFCSGLREVELPATITELESYAFSECVSLERAVLPGNGKMLGELIFSGCRGLREIVEPSPAVPTFDCASTLFEATEGWMYEACRLLVPARSVAAYRTAEGWGLFDQILGI